MSIKGILLSLSVIPWVIATNSGNVTMKKGMIAYDCTANNVVIATYSLLAVNPCMVTTKSIVTTEGEILVLQKTEKILTRARQCKLIIERRIQHCGWYSHSSEVEYSYQYMVKAFGIEECAKVHESQTLEIYPGSVISEIPRNNTLRGETTVIGMLEGSKCRGGVYRAQGKTYEDVLVFYKYEITLQDYMTEVNTEANVIKLRHGLNCEYSTGYCLDSDEGYISWSTDRKEKCENSNFEIIYSGKANKTETTDDPMTRNTKLYTARTKDTLFTIRTQEEMKVCGYNGWSTDHNRIVLIELNNGFHPFTQKVNEGVNLDLLTYLNSKVSFLEHHTEEQMTAMYAQLMSEICKIDRNILETNLIMARINPNEFAAKLTGRPGYTAVVTGEVIHTIGCEPVFVVPSPRDRCYQEIPVLYNGENFYVAPVTRIIQRHGTEIDCAPYLEAKYKFGDRWYTIDKTVRETVHPSILGSGVQTDWSYISLPDLMDKGLYDRKGIDKMRNMIFEQSDRRSVSTVIHRTVEGQNPDKQGYKMSHIFDENEIHSLINSYWEKMLNWSHTIGNVASTIFGLYIIGRIIKFFIDTIVHGRILYDVYGFSWRLVASCWDSLTSLLAHNYQRKNVDSLRVQETEKLNASAPIELQSTKSTETVYATNDIDTTVTIDEHLKACNVVVPSYHKTNK